MSISIIGLLDRFPEVVSRTIDLTLSQQSQTGARYRRGLPDPALTAMIPMTRYADAKLALQRIQERRPTIASIVGTDGEYPIRREPLNLTIETIGSVKIARARLFTEEDFDLMRQAELYLAANNPQAYQAFVDQYLLTPAYLAQSIDILATLLCIQVMVSGAATYIDPETNLGFELSYLSQVPAVNRPAGLTGTALWSDAVNSTPLTNLVNHLNDYYSNLLTFPTAIVMSSAVADALRNSNQARLNVGRMLGRISDSVTPTPAAIASLPRPTLEEVRQWIQMDLTSAAMNFGNAPEFVVSDAAYFTIAANGTINTAATPFFPTNTYFFAEPGLVEGAYVPTATNDYQGQFAFVTEVLSRAPRRERAAIDTRFLALCADARMLGWRRVLA